MGLTPRLHFAHIVFDVCGQNMNNENKVNSGIFFSHCLHLFHASHELCFDIAGLTEQAFKKKMCKKIKIRMEFMENSVSFMY